MLADPGISRRLRALSGIGSVDVVGGDTREMTVNIRPDALAAANIGIGEIVGALSAQNLAAPVGRLLGLQGERTIRRGGRVLTAQAVSERVVGSHSGPGVDEQGEVVSVAPPFVAATDTAIGWLMASNTELMRDQWLATPGAPPLVWVRPTSDRGATFAMERIPKYAELGYVTTTQALDAL